MVVEKNMRSLLVVGLLYSDKNVIDIVENEIEKHFGMIKDKTNIYDFPSHYYDDELGENVKRMWFLIDDIFLRAEVVNIKKKTIEIENKYRKNGNRIFNIDPGLLSLSAFILPTTKDYSHRIYLYDGIFVELTLIYRKGTYEPLDWTYTDYRWDTTIKTFNRWRGGLL